jgi:hypothetical protein
MPQACRRASIDGLSEGVFEPVKLPPQPVVPAPDPDYEPADLEADQRTAADALRERWRGRVRRDAARRRHRLGQDRGLFRGDRRGGAGRKGRF